MPPKYGKGKGKHLKAIFKRIVRKVILCKHLLSEITDTKIGFNAKRNVIILTRRERSTSLLTSFEKLLFVKPIKCRTMKEREDIVRIVANLKCFQLFPPKVRARIAPHLEFSKIECNRIIIREGTQPLYMYFVLSGEIVAYKMELDSYSKKLCQNNKFIVTSGDMLGHLGLLDRRTRVHTYMAISDVECLYIDEDIFGKYLRSYIQNHVYSKYLALSKYDIFDTFTMSQRNFVALFGLLKEYKPMETIFYKDHGDLNYVYFIISGQCMILQYFKTTLSKNSSNEKQYSLCPLEATSQKKDYKTKEIISVIKEMKARRLTTESTLSGVENLQKLSFLNTEGKNSDYHFIDVGTLCYGAIFGLGEPMENRAIMARTIVQCLLIPRFWLFSSEQNCGNIWQRLKVSLRTAIPSREELFKNFLINRKWTEFKKTYIHEKLDAENSKLNPTKMDDIPLACRVVEFNLEDNSDNDDK